MRTGWIREWFMGGIKKIGVKEDNIFTEAFY